MDSLVCIFQLIPNGPVFVFAGFMSAFAVLIQLNVFCKFCLADNCSWQKLLRLVGRIFEEFYVNAYLLFAIGL